jgi:DNA replication protein DnaC
MKLALIKQTLPLLKSLNLKGIAENLDEMIHDAEIQKHSYITFLNTIFSREIAYRVKRRVQRNIVGAHFPVIKKIGNGKLKSYPNGKITYHKGGKIP